MLNLIKKNFIFYLVFIPVYIGISFAVSSLPIVIGVIGIMWFMAKARYDYLVLIFLLTLILANNKAPVFSSYEMMRVLFIAVLLVLSGFVMIKKEGFDQRINYFLPFFAVAVISTFLFSPTMLNSMLKVLSYLILVITIFILIKYLLQDESVDLYEHILLLICVTLIISLIGWVVSPSVFLVSGRLNGVLSNPNFLGLYCVLAYALADHYRITESGFSRNGIYILKGLILLCLFLTGSRNGYASLAIYIILTTFLFRGFSGKTAALMIGASAVFVFLEINLVASWFPFLQALVRPETLQTASGRSLVWPVAVAEIYRQPWLGGGFSYYSYYMATFAANHNLHSVFWYGVWNTYLAFLLDTGIVGLATYCFFIFGLIRKYIRFAIILPFLMMMIFSGMFEAWAVSSLNPITPLFLLFFVIISTKGSRYENFGTA